MVSVSFIISSYLTLTLACDPENHICGDVANGLAVKIKDILYGLLKNATMIEKLEETFRQPDIMEYRNLDGKKLINEASAKLKKILKSKTDAVDNIANFVRQKSPLRQSVKRDPPTCSYILAKDISIYDKINLTYRKEFNTKVNLSETVVHFPTDVYEFSTEIKSAIHLTDGLDKVFIDNYKKDRFLFGQYFGSTSGLLRYYPAFYWDTFNETDLYDCRERPWYIEAAGQPRDIVFLMDTSGSMYGWALRVAKYTAEKLLDVISDKDHVAFYSFNKTTQSVSCFPLLERARLKYRNYLIDSVKTIQANGESNFTVALNTAFDVLENSSKIDKSCDCQKAIIIFSDYVRHNYEAVFKKRNPDRKVRVFTLAFGAPNQWDTSKLEEISCNNNGYFSQVHGYGDVVPAISNIFNVFGQPLSLNVKNIQSSWSTVYYEYDRMNFVLTVGKSVVLDYNLSVSTQIEPFLGIAAIDVDIPQMQTIMTGMFSGIMYAFMINNNGVVVVHPRLVPIPGFSQDTPDMDLNEFEETYDQADIIKIAKLMLNRTTGSVRTSSLVHFPDTLRGKQSFQNTDYYFTSLDGYPFAIGIIVPPGERQTVSVDNIKLNNTLINESIVKNVPGLLRWKKYPLCTLNITDTIKKVQNDSLLKTDPCFPDRYDTMAAEIQLTDFIANWWASEEYRNWSSENHIMDSYLVTNAGITRTFRVMNDESNVMDPMDMQPFIHSRSGIPPNTLLMSLLRKDDDCRSFNLSYSLGIPYDNDYFEVLSVGIKVRLKVLRKMLNVVFKDRENVAVTLLDENAFIIFSTDDLYQETMIDRFFDKQSGVADVVMKSKFYTKHQVKDCQQLCNDSYSYNLQQSSASLILSPLSTINKLISSIWRLFVFYITSLFLDKASATHTTPEKVMCCENYNIYSRNFSLNESYEGEADCGSSMCKKNITLTPVPKTNILLLIDNNPQCICKTSRTIRERYIKGMCEGNVSLWKSDLSQQLCFDKLKNNFTSTSESWKCSNQRK